MEAQTQFQPKLNYRNGEREILRQKPLETTGRRE